MSAIALLFLVIWSMTAPAAMQLPPPGFDPASILAANWGETGPLVKRGLIAAPPAIQARAAAIIAHETVLDPAVLS